MDTEPTLEELEDRRDRILNDSGSDPNPGDTVEWIDGQIKLADLEIVEPHDMRVAIGDGLVLLYCTRGDILIARNGLDGMEDGLAEFEKHLQDLES